jgi:hypothetical protein
VVVVVEVVAEGKPQVPAAALTPPTRTVAFVLCFFNSVGGAFVVHDSAVVAWRPLLREVTATVLAAAGAPLCMFWVALCCVGRYKCNHKTSQRQARDTNKCAGPGLCNEKSSCGPHRARRLLERVPNQRRAASKPLVVTTDAEVGLAKGSWSKTIDGEEEGLGRVGGVV